MNRNQEFDEPSHMVLVIDFTLIFADLLDLKINVYILFYLPTFQVLVFNGQEEQNSLGKETLCRVFPSNEMEQ